MARTHSVKIFSHKGEEFMSITLYEPLLSLYDNDWLRFPQGVRVVVNHDCSKMCGAASTNCLVPEKEIMKFPFHDIDDDVLILSRWKKIKPAIKSLFADYKYLFGPEKSQNQCVCTFEMGQWSCTCGAGRREIEASKKKELPVIKLELEKIKKGLVVNKDKDIPF